MNEPRWVVLADGFPVSEVYDDQDDASDFAAVWNHAYPSPPYVEFTVVEAPGGVS